MLICDTTSQLQMDSHNWTKPRGLGFRGPGAKHERRARSRQPRLGEGVKR